jgi:hypothetical protein
VATKTKWFVFKIIRCVWTNLIARMCGDSGGTLETLTCYHRFVYFGRRIARIAMRLPHSPDSLGHGVRLRSDDNIFLVYRLRVLLKRSVAVNVILVRSHEAYAGKFRIREIFFSVYRMNLSLRFNKSRMYFYRICD